LCAWSFVVGIVEAGSVFLEWLGAEDGVVENALHAVAIAAVTGDSEKIAHNFEVAIGAAGRLEAGMRFAEAGADLTTARNAEQLIRSPSAGGEALRGTQKKSKPFSRGAEMLGIAQHQIGLHGGAEGIHVAVSVFAGQNVFAAGKWIEVKIVLNETGGEFAGSEGCR